MAAVVWVHYPEFLFADEIFRNVCAGTAQNEQNNKPRTAPLVPGDRINDIIWRGSKCLGVLFSVHA